MSRDDREENVGQIAVRSDECFWILPARYVAKKDIDLYSPWFTCFGEKWQFIMSPKYYNQEKIHFYLWRKFCRDLPARQYTLQLKLKTVDGGLTAFSERHSNCDYGFEEKHFINRHDLLNHRITDCGQIKIFFEIKEKLQSAANLLSLKEPYQTDESKESVISSEDEMTSDEDDDENKRAISADKGIKLLSENLKQVLIDERMTDAVLKVDSREFKVHKIILIARSPVFASMFEHDTTEKRDNQVDIPDCTAESFEVFLHYLYSGRVETLSASNVYQVYYAADKYRVDDLKEKCIKFMIKNITVETFCDVIALSLRHSESKLQKTATDFFCQNIKKIIKTVQWQKYMDENSTQANELLIKALNA